MKAKHAPCPCGCGEMADECMSGRSNPLAAFTIRAPKGLDQIDLASLMAEPNPHGGCPDAGCGPECPARIFTVRCTCVHMDGALHRDPDCAAHADP